MKKLKLSTLLYDLSSEEYHSTPETVSSSQLKDMLDDPEVFYKKYVAKTEEKVHIAAFDVGTYFHTSLLEPHKIKKEIAVYPGKVRKGAKYEAFKKKNKNKILVTPSQRDQALKLVEAVKKSPISMKRLAKGKPEVSLFVRLRISEGKIYAADHGVVLDLRHGWINSPVPKKGIDLIAKVRADHLGSTYILDLKSTSGSAKSKSAMRSKISYYNYDLSAALYLDLFKLVLPNIKIFIWTFASKDYGNAKSWKASKRNLLVGRAKWAEAILGIANNLEQDWEFQDTMGTLEPLPHELEWLETEESYKEL